MCDMDVLVLVGIIVLCGDVNDADWVVRRRGLRDRCWMW